MARQLGQSGRGTARYSGVLLSSSSGDLDVGITRKLSHEKHEPPCHVLVWSLLTILTFYVSWYPPFMRSTAAVHTALTRTIHWNNNLHCRRVLKP